jgi:tetratricopeptide (TPR) repeat protein/tRNA A-37 threonylcarbamoyl transferase component Bud32
MGSEDVTLQASDATHPDSRGGDGPERLGRFGRFVVLEAIGSGGSGSVHRAYDPQLDRAVAIKVLHSFDSTARLLAEARAMAKLRHPNVVAVHDVGEADGQVWLAMEYVDGGTLRRWLEAGRKETEILDVFRRAGAGLAAAHQQGLVHRDFKPDNVLMHASGRPAVTDFGLALLEETPTTPAEGSSMSEQTLTSRLAGTPAYMSAEQFTGKAVGPASDQFSFGVALFEAVCGRRPFEGQSVPELCQRVTEAAFEFPADVSVRPWLRHVLERMLQREPGDRFPTMDAALRALDREPIARRRRLVAVGALVAVATGGASMVNRDSGPTCASGESTVAEVWSASRRDVVEASAPGPPSSRTAVFDALDRWSRTWSDAFDHACEATHVHGVQSQDRLDARVRCFEGQLDHLASLVDELESADAEVFHKAFGASQKLPPPVACDDPSLEQEPSAAEQEAARWQATARVRNDLGRYESGLEAVKQGLTALGERPSPERVWLLTTQGQLAWRSGDNIAAEQSLREAVRVHADARNPVGVAQAWVELALVVGDVLGESKRADGILLGAEAAVRALDDPDMERRLSMVRGNVLVRAGRLDEGVAALERAVEMTGPDDVSQAIVLGNYGNALYEAGRYADALQAFDDALAADRRVLPAGHPSFVIDHQNRSRALHRLGRNEESATVLREAIDAGADAYGSESPQLGGPYLNLGVSLLGLQKHDEARVAIERAVELWTGAYPDDHRYFDIADSNLGIIANEQEDYARALSHYEAARQRIIRREGEKSRALSTVLGNEGNTLHALERYEDAAARHREALALSESFEGTEHPGLGYPLIGLARALIEMESFDEALRVSERALRLREGKVGPAEMYLTYITLAEAHARVGAMTHAHARAESAAAAFEQTGLPDVQATELRAFQRAFGSEP